MKEESGEVSQEKISFLLELNGSIEVHQVETKRNISFKENSKYKGSVMFDCMTDVENSENLWGHEQFGNAEK